MLHIVLLRCPLRLYAELVQQFTGENPQILLCLQTYQELRLCGDLHPKQQAAGLRKTQTKRDST